MTFGFEKFDCLNTLNDQLLEKVVIKMETSDAYEIISYKPCAKLSYNVPDVAYALVRIPDDPTQGNISYNPDNTINYFI